jgi:outer membrane protein assembly factor BamA
MANNESLKYLFSIVVLYLGFHGTAYTQRTDSLRKNNHWIVVPIVSRSIETDWSFGVGANYTFHTNRKKDTLTRTSSINFVGSYSLRKQFLLLLNGPVFFPGEHFILYNHYSYSYFPDRFWGLGNGTDPEQEEPYEFGQYYINLHGKRQLAQKLFLGLILDFQRVTDMHIRSNGWFDRQDVAGRNPYQVGGMGMSVSWDNRNYTFWPMKGKLLSLTYHHYAPVFLSDYTFSSLQFDSRFFYTIQRRHVLAFQAFAQMNIGKEVPIRSLASLGGSDKMRGYFNGRFRDRHYVLFQSEYRFPLLKRISGVGFCGLGDVAGPNSTTSLQNLKYSYGAGLRYAINKYEKLHIRFDYALGRGKGNHGFYVQLGEAF